ncbi:hypothetical protein AC578_3326 [Pseudocercospora eumusae]|uniref:F-box domain-containing protein n=1 Tax=Pseudocercospora eumusae TaxID=321146 RepID=A0A139GVJ3_9PEZI|nr:hypothetical protein AC578_3326 [Pseudocercospora eumusae]
MASKASPRIADPNMYCTLHQSAASRVCNITELLEAILLQLPTRDLLFAQWVCKQWQAVIEGSVSLKKALFLMPGVSADTHPDNRCTAVSKARHRPRKDPRHQEMAHFFNSGALVINRLIGLRMTPDSVPSRNGFGTRAQGPRCLAFLHPDLLLTSPSASCLPMYITQPPVDIEIVDVDFGSLWALEPRHPRPASPRTFPKVRTVGELIGVVKERIEGREKLKIVKCLRVVLGYNYDDAVAALKRGETASR